MEDVLDHFTRIFIKYKGTENPLQFLKMYEKASRSTLITGTC